MKSNVCGLNKDLSCLDILLDEVEKVATYNELKEKDSLRLRLLAEELCGMLPGLVERFNGVFWAENDGNRYELHVELTTDGMTLEVRDELIAVSTSGKNIAAKGIMGKIRAVAESMLLAASDPELAKLSGDYYDHNGYNMGFGYSSFDAEMAAELGTIHTWSLYNYKENVTEKDIEGAVDELERSIVAKLADDILVGVKGKNVEIIVKKAF